MTLPWWETTDIVEKESELSLQKANKALDWLAEQHRLRREQAEQEALRTGRMNAQLATNFALARQRASAADEIDAANRRLQELGVQKRISMSESSISQQIMSGRTFADQYVSAKEAETRQVRLKEIRKEAEQWAKWSIRQEGANWADLNPDEQGRLIDEEANRILTERYPEEFGVPAEVAPVVPSKQAIDTRTPTQQLIGGINQLLRRETEPPGLVTGDLTDYQYEFGRTPLPSLEIPDEVVQNLTTTITLAPEDVGMVHAGYDASGNWTENRPGLNVTIAPDFNTGEFIIIGKENEPVGKVDAETGNLEFDDPLYPKLAMVMSQRDYEYLEETDYLVPPPTGIKAFDIAFTKFMTEPKQIGGVTLPSPEVVLGIIGMVGSLAYTGYAGVMALQNWYNTSQTVGRAYRYVTTKVGKPAVPKWLTSIGETKMYRDYMRTSIFRDFQKMLNVGKINPTGRRATKVDQELFRAWQLFKYENAPQKAQQILDQIRSATALPGSVSPSRAVTPYTGATAPPTQATPPVTPPVAPPAQAGGAMATQPIATPPTVPPAAGGAIATGAMQVPVTIPSKAITEAGDLLTKIGEEWIAGRPGVGFTKNQIARAKAEVAKIAQRHGIDKNELWGNVWWEAKIKPQATEGPLTEEQIEELIKSVSGKAGITITPEVTKPTAMAEGEAVSGKEPWQMTRRVWEQNARNFKDLSPKEQKVAIERIKTETGNDYISPQWVFDKRTGYVLGDDIEAHGYYVKKALSEGKPVPTEVLADYPEFQTKALAEGETITGEVPEGEITVTGIAMSPAELSKIRQTIMAAGKTKGVSKNRLTEIFKEVAGRTPDNRQMPYGLTEMTDEQLLDTLEIIKTARPMKVRAKIVIRPSTEKKIVSLKASLIKEGKLTEDVFNGMVEQLKLPTTRYESAQKFITEKEGKSLIRLMNDQAEVGLIQRQAEAAKALGRNPTVKVAYDGYSKRIAKEGRVYFQGKPADVSILKDMRFAMEDLQVRTGKPFYDVYFALNRAKNANRIYFGEAKQREIASTPQYNNLVNAKSSMKRIRDYIAAKNAWAKVKSPKDITPEEIKLANAYEKELFDLQPDFRYHRFLHHYQVTEGNIDKMQEKIPDAPKGDLREAINIYEGQGASKLKAYLDTKTWGIIKSGFEPLYVVNPNLAMRKLKAVFPTGRLEPRNIVSRDSVEFYPEDITLDKAVDRYIRQIRSYNLQPYIRELERLYGESITQLRNPYKIRRGIGSMVNEMLGYKDRSFFGELVMKAASQAYITVFGTFPNLPFRNLLQNLAHHPDKPALIDIRNKKMTAWDRQFYETHVSQMKGVERDLLLAEEGGLPGFRRINRFILRLNLYGASDSKINRVWSQWASLNKAQRALDQYKKDGNIDKFISNSGMAGLTLTQQKQVLENLVMNEVNIAGLPTTSGEHAAITEIATEITNNVHFLYDRSQRAWLEMGETGRLVGSLVVFPRSVLQRAIIQGKILAPKDNSPPFKKKRAFKELFSLLWGSLAANWLYQKATGRDESPYNPFNVLKWSPGGLTIGAVSNLAEVAGLLFMAMGGSDWAKTELPATITKTSDTFVPYYKVVIQALEAAADKKQIDRQLYRELRSIIEKAMVDMGFLDEAYEPNRSYYEAERSGEWRMKHALFGTEPEEQIPGDKARKAQLNILAQFKYSRDWDDLTRDEKEAMYSEYPDLRES